MTRGTKPDITPLPPAPNAVTDQREDFANKAASFTGALPGFGQEANELGIYMSDAAADADAAAASAQQARDQTSSLAAQANAALTTLASVDQHMNDNPANGAGLIAMMATKADKASSMVKVAQTNDGAGSIKGKWTKIATISCGSSGYLGPEIHLLISTPHASGGPHYMKATVAIRQLSQTSTPPYSSGIIEEVVQGNALISGALRLIQPANFNEPAELWLRTNSDWAYFDVAAYVVARSSVTVQWHSEQGWQAAEPTVPAGGMVIKPKRANHLRPIGERISWPGGDLPYGTVRADGAELLKAQYPELWEYAQQADVWDASNTDTRKYRPGSTADRFQLPNWDHMFERATGSGRAALSFQAHAMQRMVGTSSSFHVQPTGPSYQTNGVIETSSVGVSAANGGPSGSGSQIKFDNQGVVNTADENRPDNVAMHWLIQAF